MSKPIKSRYAGGNLFNDDMPIPVFTMESSDFHNIAESTHVMNISPIAVSAQVILSFTKTLVCDTSVILRCSNFLKKDLNKLKDGPMFAEI